MGETPAKELARFIRENLKAVGDAMDQEYARSFPRAYGTAQPIENINEQTRLHFVWMADALENGDYSAFEYERALGDCLFDPNDPELTLFASNISSMMCMGRALAPLIAQHGIKNRQEASRLLLALEEFIQTVVENNCRDYCRVIGSPRALQSKWAITSRLRQSVVKEGTLGKAYLDEKDYLRIAAKSLDMPDASEALTARENIVLKLILEGKSNAEIASGLHVSLSTIKHQVSSIFSKYGVANRAELIVEAKATGADSRLSAANNHTHPNPSMSTRGWFHLE